MSTVWEFCVEDAVMVADQYIRTDYSYQVLNILVSCIFYLLLSLPFYYLFGHLHKIIIDQLLPVRHQPLYTPCKIIGTYSKSSIRLNIIIINNYLVIYYKAMLVESQSPISRHIFTIVLMLIVSSHTDN